MDQATNDPAKVFRERRTLFVIANLVGIVGIFLPLVTVGPSAAAAVNAIEFGSLLETAGRWTGQSSAGSLALLHRFLLGVLAVAAILGAAYPRRWVYMWLAGAPFGVVAVPALLTLGSTEARSGASAIGLAMGPTAVVVLAGVVSLVGWVIHPPAADAGSGGHS